MTLWVDLIFTVLIKILFVVHLKHFSFCPSADVKPMSNDIFDAVPWLALLVNILRPGNTNLREKLSLVDILKDNMIFKKVNNVCNNKTS